ncbi:uncharacterized protein [Cardiocondyla obscurior]|uniref:uncharacterized protein n=1 Tax=Cardiocondyla obscurior TaxID=286306 RepID=UPI0039655A71
MPHSRSLNKILLPGPPLQNDLTLVLSNWRRYRNVFCTDIIKIFRQIAVHKDDQDFQRIIWIPHEGGEPTEYRLKTITYGMACAPYLSIRTLHQLVKDKGSRYPKGARCLCQQTFVNDIFGGADQLEEAYNERDELISLLSLAEFDLDKCEFLLDRAETPTNPTKRSISFCISRLFDPLGWISPVTVVGKIYLQDLWLAKVGWDEILTGQHLTKWKNYHASLRALNEIHVERWLRLFTNYSAELHGYADASSRAYAAVIYVRSTLENGDVQINLVAAKAKVSLIKTVSVPNLELCGATLLVRLLTHVRQLEFLKNLPVTAWLDSQITLSWIKEHPSKWKQFVANRVSMIQTQLPEARWRYVPTKQNPTGSGHPRNESWRAFGVDTMVVRTALAIAIA